MTQVERVYTPHSFLPGFDSDSSRRGVVGRGNVMLLGGARNESTNNIPENAETKLENLTFDSGGSVAQPIKHSGARYSSRNRVISFILLSRILVWQVDAVRMLLFPFVFLGQNPFQAIALAAPPRCCPRKSGRERRVVKDGELPAATLTPNRADFRESWCPFFRLILPDHYCSHGLILYLSA